MSDKQKHGRPWDVNGRFETYEEANHRRQNILKMEDNRHDVKVRRLSIGVNRWAFFVKTRLIKKYENEKQNKRTKKARVRNKAKKQRKQNR